MYLGRVASQGGGVKNIKLSPPDLTVFCYSFVQISIQYPFSLYSILGLPVYFCVFLILLSRWQHRWKNPRKPRSQLASAAANSYQQPAPNSPFLFSKWTQPKVKRLKLFSSRFNQLCGDGKNDKLISMNKGTDHEAASLLCWCLFCILKMSSIFLSFRAPYKHGYLHHYSGHLVQPNTKPPGFQYVLDSCKIYNDAIYWPFCQPVLWTCCKVITMSPDPALKLRKLAWRQHFIKSM